jgi:hypothetical protein
MGTALLIIVEVFGWLLTLIALCALIESGWARLRRGRKRTIAD